MDSSKLAKRESGFTLVELLIVAIILAILAAIIVPQFASTTTDATESALRANVAGMRSAIDLYRQQHGEYPGVATAVPDGSVTCGGTAGTGAGGNQATLQSQLTLYSNRNGMTCSAAGADFPFGPYIQEDALPTNPITDDDTVVIVTDGDLNMTPATAGGWQYDSVIGKFIVDDDTLDSQGVAYSTYRSAKAQAAIDGAGLRALWARILTSHEWSAQKHSHIRSTEETANPVDIVLAKEPRFLVECLDVD